METLNKKPYDSERKWKWILLAEAIFTIGCFYLGHVQNEPTPFPFNYLTTDTIKTHLPVTITITTNP